MNKQYKFLIVNDEIRIGYVDENVELSDSSDGVIGGGFFKIENKNVYFYGKNDKYNEIKLKDLSEVRRNGFINETLQGLTWYISENGKYVKI